MNPVKSVPSNIGAASSMIGSSGQVSDDQQWVRVYTAFDHTETFDVTLQKLTALACGLHPWYSGAMVAIDEKGGFIERLVETGEPAPIFALMPTRWPLATSPCRDLLHGEESLLIEDIVARREYPLYQAEAMAQAYRGVALSLCGTDARGRPLALCLHSRDVIEKSDRLREMLSRLVCIATGEIYRAKFHDLEKSKAGRLNEYATVATELMDSVLNGQSAAEVVGQMPSDVGFRLALIDISAQRVHVTHARDEALAANLLSEWQSYKLSRTGLLNGCSDRTESVGPSLPIFIEGRLAGAAIYLGGSVATDEVSTLLQYVKPAFGALLLRSYLQAVGVAAGLRSIFETLGTGTWQDVKLFAASARHMGLDTEAPAQIFALTIDDGALADVPEMLAHSLPACCPGALCGRVADLLLIYIPCPADGLSSMLKDRLWGVVGDALSLCKHALAESPVITAIENYPATIRSLRHVLRLARALDRSGRVSMSTFDPFAFLAAAIDKNAAPEFIASTLGQIRRYDVANSAHFLQTCMIFSESGCRYQETADRLHVHVSTLRHRMTRIGELFNIDLADPDVRFSLDLAFRLERLLGQG
jgi:PucR C-terminal helix-turn-helix domain